MARVTKKAPARWIAPEGDVAPVHDVEASCLQREHVEYLDLVQLAVRDVQERWNRASQVEQCMQLDGGLGGTKRRPAEQAQTQVDGGGVQRIDGSVEIEHRGVVRIQRAGVSDQPLGQRLIDAPVAQVQGIGQSRTRRRRPQSHVKQLVLVGCHAGLDVAQRLAPGELREGHDAEDLGAAQSAHSGVSAMPLDDPSKALPWHELHDLCEQRLAHVHASPRIAQTPKHRKTARRFSNRGHPEITPTLSRK